MSVKKHDIQAWVEATSGDWFELNNIKQELNISDEHYGNLRKVMHSLCQGEDAVCEALGGKTGRYRKINRESTAIKFWETIGARNKIVFPRSVIDDTYFSFEEQIELEPVTTIVIGGVSNSGKTAIAMNILLYNINNIYIKYFSNENNRFNFNKRIESFSDTFDIFKKHPPESIDDCKFQYIKRSDNYSDIIYGAGMYIIDWVSLDDEVWKISKVIKGIKDKLEAQGEGIGVILLQKDDKKPNPRGDTWVKDHTDLLFTIDFMGKERRLTIVKCKVNGSLDGKMWGFGIEPDGIRMKNIRRIIQCETCHTSGKVYNKFEKQMETCSKCRGTGYVDYEDWNHDVK